MTKAARARGERLESGGTRHDRVKDDCAHAPAAAIAIALDVRRKNAPPHTPLAVRNLAESTRASAYAANGVRNSSQGACGPGSHIAPSPHGASNAAVGGAVDWKDAVAADQQGSRALRTQYLVIISGAQCGEAGQLCRRVCIVVAWVRTFKGSLLHLVRGWSPMADPTSNLSENRRSKQALDALSCFRLRC